MTNKVTVKNLKVLKLMRELDYDPIRELILLSRDQDITPGNKIAIHKELACYAAPKLKSIEPAKSDAATDMGVEIVQFSKEKPPKEKALVN